MPQDDSAVARKAADSTDAILAYWGTDLRCQWASAAHEKKFGRSQREMLGISLEEFLGPRYESILPYALGALSGEAQIFECEITLHDGTISRGIVRYYPDVVDGIVQGFTVYVADDEMVKHLQMQLEEANSRNHHLASHDYLTGLPNRVLLTDRIRTFLSKANSSGEMVGLVVMNVDGFRRINDTYGLDGGDAVIREVARRMKGAVHPTETLIRTNGDEFLLLVPAIQVPLDVNLAVDSILRDVQQPLRYGQAEFVPNLSFGTAVFPLDGETPLELLAKADRMLDQARRSG